MEIGGDSLPHLSNKPSSGTALKPAKSNGGLCRHGRPPEGGDSSPGGLSLLRVTVQLDVSLWWGGNGTQWGDLLRKRQRHQIMKGESSGPKVWSRSWSRSRIRALSSQDQTRVIQLAFTGLLPAHQHPGLISTLALVPEEKRVFSMGLGALPSSVLCADPVFGHLKSWHSAWPAAETPLGPAPTTTFIWAHLEHSQGQGQESSKL